MSANLLEAIDELVAFVAKFGATREINGVLCHNVLTSDDAETFRALDRRVFSFAFEVGLQAALPRSDDLARAWKVKRLPSVQFLGKTQLPCDRNGDEFLILPAGRWHDDMTALRELAARPEKQDPQPDSRLLSDERIRSIVEDTSKSADDRLHALSRIDQRFFGWKSPTLGKLLGVKGAAIRQTGWWRIDRVAWLAKQQDRD